MTGQFLHQDSGGAVSDGDEAFDKCGQGLAAGDFNSDNRDDLAIGCPGEDTLSSLQFDTGSVHVLYGTSVSFAQGGVIVIFSGGRCGAAVTAGDFNDDTFDDFALGCTEHDSGAGVVRVYSGAPTFLEMTFRGQWSQNSEGIADASEAGDNFGHAVSAGDFDGDGYADLAVGVPNEDQVSGNNVGAVNVLYGPLRPGFGVA